MGGSTTALLYLEAVREDLIGDSEINHKLVFTMRSNTKKTYYRTIQRSLWAMGTLTFYALATAFAQNTAIDFKDACL